MPLPIYNQIVSSTRLDFLIGAQQPIGRRQLISGCNARCTQCPYRSTTETTPPTDSIFWSVRHSWSGNINPIPTCTLQPDNRPEPHFAVLMQHLIGASQLTGRCQSNPNMHFPTGRQTRTAFCSPDAIFDRCITADWALPIQSRDTPFNRTTAGARRTPIVPNGFESRPADFWLFVSKSLYQDIYWLCPNLSWWEFL